MSKISLFLLLAFIFVSANLSYGRLEDTPAKSAKRYGTPVIETHIHMVPLCKSAQELRYHHNGWRIRSAYVENKAIIVSYTKLARQGTQEARFTSDDIATVLKEEKKAGYWKVVSKGEKMTRSKRYQSYFNSASRVWLNSNGSIAWIPATSNGMNFISPIGLAYVENL